MEALSPRTLYILIGPPGCGKSAVAWQMVNRGALRISGDDIFFAITDKTHGYWREKGVMDAVNAAADLLVEGLMERGLVIVADRTHLTPRGRGRRIAMAQRYGYRVEGLVWENFDQARERNSQRSGRDRVPEEIWTKMVSAWQPPTLDEGFDALKTLVGPDGKMR